MKSIMDFLNIRRLMSPIFIAFLFLFSSCNIENKGLIGTWSIDYCEYNNEQLDLGTNLISFKTKESRLPDLWNEDALKLGSNNNDNFNWELYRNEDNRLLLKIDSENNLFAGNYYVTYFKDEEQKLLMMELKNDNLLIICRKGFVNFDKEKSFIEKLIKRTNN